jgi:hypothetical protein
MRGSKSKKPAPDGAAGGSFCCGSAGAEEEGTVTRRDAETRRRRERSGGAGEAERWAVERCPAWDAELNCNENMKTGGVDSENGCPKTNANRDSVFLSCICATVCNAAYRRIEGLGFRSFRNRVPHFASIRHTSFADVVAGRRDATSGSGRNSEGTLKTEPLSERRQLLKMVGLAAKPLANACWSVA